MLVNTQKYGAGNGVSECRERESDGPRGSICGLSNRDQGGRKKREVAPSQTYMDV